MRNAGTVAAGSLGAAVVLAPLLAGGWRLPQAPFFAGPALFAWAVLVAAAHHRGRRLSVPWLAVALAALALFTALQALPIGPLLDVLSPRAAEMREFTGAPSTVSYALGATWREASKLLLYALAAVSAHELARRLGARRVLMSIPVAGVAVMLGGLGHRLLGAERLFGLFGTDRPPSTLVTTFQNPNHASAFLAFSALVTLGLGVGASARTARFGLLAVGAGLAAGAALEPSKGGVLALGFGLGLFGWLLWRRGSAESLGLPVLLGALVLPLLGLALQLDAVLLEFGVGDGGRPLGFEEKFAAMQDAGPILGDHMAVGIGRGAYVSVQPHYQTSALQLLFAFPENLVAQWLTEWGLLVGGAAIAGLSVLMYRLLARAERPHEVGAAAALACIVAHDLVDFSLEMPGVALAAVVVAGAFDRRAALVKVGAGTAVALTAVPLGLAFLGHSLAVRSGDLFTDLAWLSDSARSAEPVDRNDVERRWGRHPHDPRVAVQVAHLLFVASPDDPRPALEAVNRAMALGPRYAEPHRVAARILLRAGRRDQALVELRAAWAEGGPTATVLADVAAAARSPADLLRAVPRSTEDPGQPDPEQTLRLARALMSAGRAVEAQALLDALPPFEALPPPLLPLLAAVAHDAGDLDRARGAVERGRMLAPDDLGLVLVLARIERRAGDLERARERLRDVPPGMATAPLLELRLELATAARDIDDGQEALALLERALPLTRKNQVRLAQLEARLVSAVGRPDRAVAVLGQALEWEPGNLDLRLARAGALVAVGRPGEARVDVDHVLRRAPEHPHALALKARLAAKQWK